MHNTLNGVSISLITSRGKNHSSSSHFWLYLMSIITYRMYRHKHWPCEHVILRHKEIFGLMIFTSTAAIGGTIIIVQVPHSLCIVRNRI